MTFKHEFTEPFGIFDITNSILQITSWQRNIIVISLIFSSICLIISFIVYSLISELRSLPGKCLMGLIVSQLITNAFLLAAFYLTSRTVECFITGIFLHYFSLTSMYWTNIIGYDLMCKLLSPLTKRTSSHFKRYIFIVYFIPALILCVALLNELNGNPMSIFKPEYGKIHCGISSWTAKLIYISIPVIISVIFNMIIFICAVFRMRQFAVELQHVDIFVPPLSRRIGYFGKLSLLLGFSSMFGYLGIQVGNNQNVRFVIFLYNTLQGVYIFVAFTCKRSVINKLKKRSVNWRLSLSRTVNSQNNITSLNGLPPRAQSCKF